MCFGNFRAKKYTNILQFLFFAREGVKIRNAVPRYLRGLRKMRFDGIDVELPKVLSFFSKLSSVFPFASYLSHVLTVVKLAYSLYQLP